MTTQNTKRLTLEDIESNKEVYGIYQIISAFMHHRKSYGTKQALEDFKDCLDTMLKKLPKYEFCALVAVMEHFDSSFNYDENMKMDKVIIPIDLWMDIYKFREYDKQEMEDMINEEYSKGLPEFLKRNIILEEVDDVF